MPSNDLNQFRTEPQGHAFLWEMNKPSKKKLKKELEKPVKKAKEQDPPAPEEDKAFDFGGLPNRDLKKNLGCG